MPVLLRITDASLTVFHIGIVLFNVLGWMYPPYRPLHRLVLLLTSLSWFGLGYRFGWGYCVLTDLQWRIKRKLGVQNLPESFIQFLLAKCGLALPHERLEKYLMTILMLCIVMTVAQTILN